MDNRIVLKRGGRVVVSVKASDENLADICKRARDIAFREDADPYEGVAVIYCGTRVPFAHSFGIDGAQRLIWDEVEHCSGSLPFDMWLQTH